MENILESSIQCLLSPVRIKNKNIGFYPEDERFSLPSKCIYTCFMVSRKP